MISVGPVYCEFSTPEELRACIPSIDELRELVQPRLVRMSFLSLGEKFTGRRQLLELLQQDLTAHSARGIAQLIGLHDEGALARPLGGRSGLAAF